MDEAMLRRFQMKVDFRMPNKEERLAIIEHYLSQRAEKVLPDMDLRHLVEVTEGRSPADLETIVNQAGITAVQAGGMIGADTLMQAAERVMVGNVNANTTKERERDRRIIAIHEWGHFLVDFELERKQAGGDWEQIQSEMKTIKISLKANPRNNALGFVFHKQGANLLKTKGDIEHDVRVLLGGMANEELFFGEEGTTNGAHNDITRVTKLLHHAVGEMGMYRKTRLNFGALSNDGHGRNRRRGNAHHHGSAERAPVRRDQGTAGAPEAADRAPGRQADGRGRDEPEGSAVRDPQLRGGLLQLQCEDGSADRGLNARSCCSKGCRWQPFFCSWPSMAQQVTRGTCVGLSIAHNAGPGRHATDAGQTLHLFHDRVRRADSFDYLVHRTGRRGTPPQSVVAGLHGPGRSGVPGLGLDRCGPPGRSRRRDGTLAQRRGAGRLFGPATGCAATTANTAT